MVENEIVVYDRTWSVYCHKNKTNGKLYFGITSKLNVNDRWRNGGGYNNSSHFYYAIKKYGWNGFDHIIIKNGLLKNEASIYEICLIAYYDTCNDKNGYNIQCGGFLGNYGIKCSEKTRLKITGKNNIRSKPVVCLNTKEHFESINLAAKKYKINHNDIVNNCNSIIQYAGFINGEYCKWLWELDYNSLSNTEIEDILNKTVSITNSRMVICLNNQKIFNSSAEASKYYNMSFASGIIKCCTKIRSFSGVDENGENLVWMYYDEFESLSSEEKYNTLNFNRTYKRRSIPTKIICLNTLEIFNTCKETGKYTTSKDGKHLLVNIDKNKPYAKHPVTKEALYWMRLKDYEEKSDIEKKNLRDLYYTGSFLMPKIKKEAV